MTSLAHTDYSEALDRGLSVLALFSSTNKSLSQAEVAKELDLPRATVRRSILTLHHLGYLESEGRQYKLAPKVLELATAFLESHPAASVLQQLCDQMCETWQSPSGVAIPDQADAIMIARATPSGFSMVDRGIGLRIPLQTSATGRVLVANNVSPLTEDFFADADAAFHAEIKKIKDNGFAYAADDVQAGFHSVAVPVKRRDGVVIAALNLGTSTGHHSPKLMCTTIVENLKSKVEEIQNQLI